MTPVSSVREKLALVARIAVLLTTPMFAIVFGQGCDCDDILNAVDDAGPGGGNVCSLATQCDDGDIMRHGKCVRSGCEAETDCCPGTRCRLDFNTCWPYALDSEFACEEDVDCADPGQRCKEVVIGDRDPIKACIFESCTGAAACGSGRTCFHGVCVKNAPCGGGCPDGEVCDVSTGTCAATPAGATGCDAPCDGLLVLADPATMAGEQCCPSICQCKGLPPLVPTKFGKFASVAVAGSEVLVSTYDSEYGDLVVAAHKLDGSLSRVSYVDGVPAGAPVVADRTGPRGGIAEVGPNVGTHTSIVVDGQNRARVAYHDVDNRALKVAVQAAGGFTTHTVDAPTGDGRVGYFTDIGVDAASGIITVSYLATDVTGAPGIGGPASALKIARSRNAEPTSSTDWDIFFADARPAFDACGGTCAATEACVLGDGPECIAVAPTCPSSCSQSQTCVQLPEPNAAGDTAECRAPPLPKANDGFPRARGLHTKVHVDNGTSYVVHYDAVDGDVRLTTLSSTGVLTNRVVDGDGVDGRRSGDVGRHPSVTTAFGEVLIVYSDFSRHEVRAWRGQPGSAGTFTTVDTGKVPGAAGKHFVGAGAQVVNAGTRAVVVYQDASSLNLQLATTAGTTWTVENLLDEGAHGFYSDVAVANGTAFVVSVLARLDARDAEETVLSVLPRPLP